ncbi:EexN family lipoprotein [Massilia varians]|uniref:EexN family lipoprotein n=1 Tax=Massilia varians TaxID=457921 RepID=UPI002552E262|nr:EexN family lipoprotein [Massilia varians]MDK6079776.1 EexN family lipoprotein [Massilia varians]
MKKHISFPYSRTGSIATALLVLLTGCGKTSAPEVEVKTVAYYTDHPEERERTIDDCIERRQAEEGNAAFMNNCENAAVAKHNAHQKAMRDAAAKYAK